MKTVCIRKRVYHYSSPSRMPIGAVGFITTGVGGAPVVKITSASRINTLSQAGSVLLASMPAKVARLSRFVQIQD